MPTLRDIIDNRTIIAAAPKASKPSPVAQHIADHVQDPFSATKDGFSDLQQKRNEYDMSREKMQRNLAPVQSVIDHAALMHGLTVGSGMSNPMPGTPPMGTAGVDPNDPNADPNAMQDDPDMGGQGVPQNMGQQPGNKMNQARPSVVGNQPGVAPGPQQSVRPPKLGMAQPGKPKAGIPQPGVNKSNPQNMQYNKQAAPPKGNKSLPGAKGPGDPKNAAKNKKAQDGTTGRQIKVNVSAFAERQESQFGFGMLKAGGVTSSASSIIKAGGPGSGRHKELMNDTKSALKQSNKLGETRLSGFLQKFHDHLASGKDPTQAHADAIGKHWSRIDDKSVKHSDALDYQENRRLPASRANYHEKMGGRLNDLSDTLSSMSDRIKFTPEGDMEAKSYVEAAMAKTGLFKKKKMKAGPAQESDKVNDSGSEVAYNAVMRSHALKSGCKCAKCKAKMMEAAGSKEGAMKGWGTRGRGNPKGHASEKELKSKRIKIARIRTTGVGHHRPGKMSNGKGKGMRMPNPAFA